MGANLHAPCIGLINPKSGGKKGEPILEVCRRTNYYKERIFHIIEVVKSKKPGGLLDDFRNRLNEAKAHAAEKNDPRFRPRIICGGGDGTASFVLSILFGALEANPERGELMDRGNGFIWSDEEMNKYFPALIQMPLGTGNDLGGIFGLGRKYPGYVKMGGIAGRGKALVDWFDMVLRVTTPVVPFDVWGFMPPPGSEHMNVKVCELNNIGRVDGKKQFIMKPADIVVPFLVLLYSSFGFSGQVIAEFQLKRCETQFQNLMQYVKISAPLLTYASRPPQLRRKLEGFSVGLPEEDGGTQYFPPRATRKDTAYGEVGFLNINSYSGGNITGKDRATCTNRWLSCGSGRTPVQYGDGAMDLFRARQLRTFAKVGTKYQTDKKHGAVFKYEAAKGQGLFFQYDGEGRFAFSPDGEPWRMDVRHVFQIPVVVAPWMGNDDRSAGFSFTCTPEEIAATKHRITRWTRGDLVPELNATREEIERAGLPLVQQ